MPTPLPVMTHLPAAVGSAPAVAATGAPAAVAGGTPGATATLSPALAQQLAGYAQAGHETALAQHAPWLTHLFAGVFVVSAVLLVVLLAIQTTKQEGLSGTVGGRVESAYRPRLGFEQQLVRITTFVAITFVVSATLVSISGI